MSISTTVLCLMCAVSQGQTLDLHANYNTVGVNVKLAIPDPEKDATAVLEYGPAPDKLTRGVPLSRVDNEFNRLSGCIFWCESNTTYHVRVTLQDPTTKAIHGVKLEGSITTRKEPTIVPASKTFFVSPNGKGTTFTRANPGDLRGALAQVGPGQAVVLLAGRYYAGDLILGKSGTDKAPIRIEGDDKAEVTIDGSDPRPITWHKGGGRDGIYFTDTAAVNPNLVLADGKRLFPHRRLDDLALQKISAGISLKGIVRFDADLDGFYRNPSSNPLLNENWRIPQRLYVAFRDKSDPNKKQMIVTRYRTGLTIAGKSNVVIRNIRFAHFGLSPTGGALVLRDCRAVVLDRCTFGVNDIGVILEGDCRDITIQDCEFFDAMAGFFSWKIKATYDEVAPYSAIFPYLSRNLERGGLIYQHGFRGRGIVVRRCKFHDFGQAGHLGPASPNPAYADSHEIDFHDNQVWNCAEDGFELDGDARNVRISGNTFHHCCSAVSMAVAQSGPIYMGRNVFHSLTEDIFTINPADGLKKYPGRPFKFQTGDAKSRVGDFFFWHNTVVSDTTGYGMDLVEPARWTRFQARNNLIVTNKQYCLNLQTSDRKTVDMDHNGYFRKNGGELGSMTLLGPGGAMKTSVLRFPDFRTLGWEKNGILADPKFRNSAMHDYRLTPTSPAVDRGVVIQGFNERAFIGKAPDLGAFELEN